MFKKALRKIREIDRINDFQPRWYGIFFKSAFITRRQYLNHINKFIKEYPAIGKKILDIGCGEKPYENLFTGSEYIGIDIEGGGHDDKLKKVDKFFDGANIPFPDKEFDIILLIGVLEHAEEIDALMKEAARVLKDTGIVFIAIPFANHEHAIPYDFRRLTSFGLIKLAKKCGLNIKTLNPTCGIFATMGQLISFFLFDEFSKLIKKSNYKLKFVLQKLFSFIVCSPIQMLSLFFDKIFGKRGISLSYIVTMKK